MNTLSKTALIVTMSLVVGHAIAQAATPDKRTPKPSASYVYTKALTIDESGVAKLPSTYVWSIETSWSGIDANGRNLPDTRVMLRLHDPKLGFSAMTSQIDLGTAERIHRELGKIIVAKRKNPDYQDRSHFGPHANHPGVPIMQIIGVDSNGVAILKERE